MRIWLRIPKKIREPTGESFVIEFPKWLDMIQKIRRAQGSTVGPSHRRFKAIACIQSNFHFCDVSIAHLLLDRPTKSFGKEITKQTVRILQRFIPTLGAQAAFLYGRMA